jgi:hypothetical protein
MTILFTHTDIVLCIPALVDVSSLYYFLYCLLNVCVNLHPARKSQASTLSYTFHM